LLCRRTGDANGGDIDRLGLSAITRRGSISRAWRKVSAAALRNRLQNSLCNWRSASGLQGPFGDELAAALPVSDFSRREPLST